MVSASPFAVLQKSIDLLTTGPGQPVLPTGDVSGLDASELGAGAVVTALRDGPVEVTDALWRRVLRRSRSGQANWTVVAAGAMLPRLVVACSRFGRVPRGHVADVEAEMLAALLEEMRRLDLLQSELGTRLWRAAANTACRWGYHARRDRQRFSPQQSLDRPATRHVRDSRGPVSVLAEALAAGMVTEVEAELIARSRLESQTLAQAAHDLGLTYITARRWRKAAEERLARSLGRRNVPAR
ncbi:hypothetical protein FHX37_2621 [Haloactinospora alba]|uniref:Uncharacterized protein n=1 Tax=Haloactinospora alba TaxID=405555 RepID=A0A543NLG3_9ACTN|nr:hypothetical protein FHX37_2621 [Haloactinospora alba]